MTLPWFMTLTWLIYTWHDSWVTMHDSFIIRWLTTLTWRTWLIVCWVTTLTWLICTTHDLFVAYLHDTWLIHHTLTRDSDMTYVTHLCNTWLWHDSSTCDMLHDSDVTHNSDMTHLHVTWLVNETCHVSYDPRNKWVYI